jgi:flagellar FliL protein
MPATTDKPQRIANGGSPSDVSSAKSGKASRKKGDGKAGKKKKSMKLKIGVLLLVLLVGGVAAKFTVLAPKPAAANTKTAAVRKKPPPGPVLPIAETTVNLADGHFLSIALAIETVKGTSEELDVSEASDIVITEFSDRTMASLSGAAARDKAKKDLIKKLEVAYPKEVQDLYYTKFVMQ